MYLVNEIGSEQVWIGQACWNGNILKGVMLPTPTLKNGKITVLTPTGALVTDTPGAFGLRFMPDLNDLRAAASVAVDAWRFGKGSCDSLLTEAMEKLEVVVYLLRRYE